jgi:hypothetical protein
MSEGKIASIGVDSPEPAASASKYDRLIAEAKRSAAAQAIAVHPCDETSLRGAVEAAAMVSLVLLWLGQRPRSITSLANTTSISASVSLSMSLTAMQPHQRRSS